MQTFGLQEKKRRGNERRKKSMMLLSVSRHSFPPWTREGLIKEAIEFPSTYWLEPIASFDCENSGDSQFDMPITRKAFVFHCFDSTVKVPSQHPKVDRELNDYYLQFGQPQYLTWSA